MARPRKPTTMATTSDKKVSTPKKKKSPKSAEMPSSIRVTRSQARISAATPKKSAKMIKTPVVSPKVKPSSKRVSAKKRGKLRKTTATPSTRSRQPSTDIANLGAPLASSTPRRSKRKAALPKTPKFADIYVDSDDKDSPPNHVERPTNATPISTAIPESKRPKLQAEVEVNEKEDMNETNHKLNEPERINAASTSKQVSEDAAAVLNLPSSDTSSDNIIVDPLEDKGDSPAPKNDLPQRIPIEYDVPIFPTPEEHKQLLKIYEELQDWSIHRKGPPPYILTSTPNPDRIETEKYIAEFFADCLGTELPEGSHVDMVSAERKMPPKPPLGIRRPKRGPKNVEIVVLSSDEELVPQAARKRVCRRSATINLDTSHEASSSSTRVSPKNSSPQEAEKTPKAKSKSPPLLTPFTATTQVTDLPPVSEHRSPPPTVKPTKERKIFIDDNLTGGEYSDDAIIQPAKKSEDSFNDVSLEEETKTKKDKEASNDAVSRIRIKVDKSRERFVKCETEKFDEVRKSMEPVVTTLKGYQCGRRLGSGTFGCVFKVFNIVTGHITACKSIPKQHKSTSRGKPISNSNSITSEKSLMNLNHPNILRLFQIIDQDTYVHFIVEYCHRNSLYGLVLDESQAAPVFRQIVEGVGYLHSLHFIHRDLKCGNIMVDKNFQIKIADFGLCVSCPPNYYLTEKVGTPTHQAPEMLATDIRYTKSADIWSLGCVLFELLHETSPFSSSELDPTRKKTIVANKVKTANYTFPKREPALGNKVKAFIDSMLTVDPKMRPNIDGIRKSQWFKKFEKTSCSDPTVWLKSEKVNEEVLDFIQNNYNKDKEIIKAHTTEGNFTAEHGIYNLVAFDRQPLKYQRYRYVNKEKAIIEAAESFVTIAKDYPRSRYSKEYREGEMRRRNKNYIPPPPANTPEKSFSGNV